MCTAWMDGYVLGYSIAGVVWNYGCTSRSREAPGGAVATFWLLGRATPMCSRATVRGLCRAVVRWVVRRLVLDNGSFDLDSSSVARMGLPGEQVAYGLIVASYRRRMGVIAVREMARHRYRQSQFAGLTRLQLDEIGRERQVQWQGRQRAGGRRWRRGRWSSRRRWFPWRVRSRVVWLSECGCDAGRCRLLIGIVLRSGGNREVCVCV